MSCRSGGNWSEGERKKKSKDHGHHKSSSDRKRRSRTSSPNDESVVKRSRREDEGESSSRSNEHTSSYRSDRSTGYNRRDDSERKNHKNYPQSNHSSRRPRSRSRSRSRERRRTPDYYGDRSRVPRNRSPDWSREKSQKWDSSSKYKRYSSGRNSMYTGKAPSRATDQADKSELKTKEGDDSGTSNPVSLESLIKPGAGGPGATKLVEEIEKRKLLFSKKEKSTEPSSTVWDKTKFSQDSDGKMTAKFKRLMGIKDEGSANIADDQPPPTSTKQKDYFADLEKQYEVARATTHTQRGVGLGFSSSRAVYTLKPKP